MKITFQRISLDAHCFDCPNSSLKISILLEVGGGEAMGYFWEKQILSLKNIVFAEKNNVATSCTKKKFRCAAKRKQHLTPKKTIAPTPLQVKWVFPNVNI